MGCSAALQAYSYALELQCVRNDCRTAVLVASAQQDSEISDLQSAIALTNQSLIELINAAITSNYTSQIEALKAQFGGSTNNVSFRPNTPPFFCLKLPLL